MTIRKPNAQEMQELQKSVKARGRARKYNIDFLGEWEIYEFQAELEGTQLLSAVKAVIAQGKRRGWNLARVGTHSVLRIGRPETKPEPARLEDAL